MLMAFTADADYLHEGISVPYSVALVESSAANKTIVLVGNETSNNIRLDNNTYFAKVEIINSITSFQVKKISAINRHHQ